MVQGTGTSIVRQLVLQLDFAASIGVGDAVALLEGSSVTSRLEGIAAATSSVVLLPPLAPIAPVATVAGPTSIGAACPNTAASDVAFDASGTPASAGRPVTLAWSSPDAALQALATAAGSTSRLVLPGSQAAALAAGTYTLRLTATNWLGATQTATFTVSKEAEPLPAVTVVGGRAQTFLLANGISVQSAIGLASICPGVCSDWLRRIGDGEVLGLFSECISLCATSFSVCAGRNLSYLWDETSGLLQPGSFTATRPDLRIEVRTACTIGQGAERTHATALSLPSHPSPPVKPSMCRRCAAWMLAPRCASRSPPRCRARMQAAPAPAWS